MPNHDTGYDNPRTYKDSSPQLPQLIDFYYQRKALIDERPKMYFGRLADTTTMP